MIFIELVLDASAETREDVAELAHRTAAATRPEEGCILYRFSTDVEFPNRFVLTELWESEEHLKAHFAGEAFKSFFAELPAGGSFVSSRAWEGALAPYTPPDPGIRRS
jgi:quinol monooxygenase YgiN